MGDRLHPNGAHAKFYGVAHRPLFFGRRRKRTLPWGCVLFEHVVQAKRTTLPHRFVSLRCHSFWRRWWVSCKFVLGFISHITAHWTSGVFLFENGGTCGSGPVEMDLHHGKFLCFRSVRRGITLGFRRAYLLSSTRSAHTSSYTTTPRLQSSSPRRRRNLSRRGSRTITIRLETRFSLGMAYFKHSKTQRSGSSLSVSMRSGSQAIQLPSFCPPSSPTWVIQRLKRSCFQPRLISSPSSLP